VLRGIAHVRRHRRQRHTRREQTAPFMM